MKVSSFPIFTLKGVPSEAEVPSHQLMIKSGMIRKLSSGQYSWYPLGYKVVKKIEEVIRQELNNIGCREILMPTVQPAELWQDSDRWDKYGPELLRFKDRNNRDFCLGPTFEEVITDLVKNDVSSYKNLPINLFQISSKFRDEIRPRFGVMRAREFIMKDAYSFHESSICLDKTYELYKTAYKRIFERLMLDYTIVDADSGNIGGDVSHEFHIIADIGEDDLLLDKNMNGMNIEIAKVKYSEHDLPKLIKKSGLTHKKGIEVGHIFKLGQKYSTKMGASVTSNKSEVIDMFMGCYGIGVTRIVAAAIEQNYDDKGIIWPSSLSPFNAAIIEIDGNKNKNVRSLAQKLYDIMQSKKIDVILDDRQVTFGNKSKDWELIGVPNIFIIGKKESEEQLITFQRRADNKKEFVKLDDIEKLLEKLSI